MSEFTAPTFNRRLRPRRSLFVVVTVAALQSIAVAVDDLPEWGSPGPTSRCRGVSLWCTGPTRAPLKTTHYQFVYFVISCHFACIATLIAQLKTLRLLAILILPRALSAHSPIFCSRSFVTFNAAPLRRSPLSYRFHL